MSNSNIYYPHPIAVQDGDYLENPREFGAKSVRRMCVEFLSLLRLKKVSEELY